MELERRLAHELLGMHPQDATVVLEELPLAEAREMLARAHPESAARVLEWAAPHFAAAVLRELEATPAARMIEHLPPEVAAGLLRRIEGPAREGLLGCVSPGCARLLRPLLLFPPGTAGALMDTRALGITDDLTVEAALERLRPESGGILFNVYVLDRSDRLVGVVNLRDLLTASPGSRVVDHMKQPVPALTPDAGTAEILAHPAWQELHSIPVVDERGALLGAVRYRTYRRLEAEALRMIDDPRGETARALGELLFAGIGGVMGAVTSALGTGPDQRNAKGG